MRQMESSSGKGDSKEKCKTFRLQIPDFNEIPMLGLCIDRTSKLHNKEAYRPCPFGIETKAYSDPFNVSMQGLTVFFNTRLNQTNLSYFKFSKVGFKVGMSSQLITGRKVKVYLGIRFFDENGKLMLTEECEEKLPGATWEYIEVFDGEYVAGMYGRID